MTIDVDEVSWTQLGAFRYPPGNPFNPVYRRVKTRVTHQMGSFIVSNEARMKVCSIIREICEKRRHVSVTRRTSPMLATHVGDHIVDEVTGKVSIAKSMGRWVVTQIRFHIAGDLKRIPSEAACCMGVRCWKAPASRWDGG